MVRKFYFIAFALILINLNLVSSSLDVSLGTDSDSVLGINFISESTTNGGGGDLNSTDFWQIFTDQTEINGSKSGSFDLTTTGIIDGNSGSNFGTSSSYWNLTTINIFGADYPILKPTMQYGNFGLIEGGLIITDPTIGGAGNVALLFTDQAGANFAQILYDISEDQMIFQLANNYSFDSDILLDGNLYMNDNDIIDVDNIGFFNGQNISWNSNDYTIDVPTGLGPVNQVGQEDYEIVYNSIGFTLDNGEVIYWDSNENDRPTIGLAYSRDQNISEKTIGFLTMDIANGTEGIAVTRGRVRGINTSMANVGDTVYLHPTINGSWTTTRPTGGDYIVILGIVCKVGVTDGEICARNAMLVSPNDLNDATGFPEQNAQIKQSDASFYDSNRSFSLAPNSGGGYDTFYVWQNGFKYLFNESQDLQIPNEEGTFWLYFDLGNLTYTKDPSNGQQSTIIREKVLVSMIYWNANDEEAVIIGDERHGHIMSSDTHTFLHFTKGSQWLNGLALNSILPDESGNDDTHAQFGVDSGTITDEDLINIISSISSTTGLPILYLNGSGADLRRKNQTGFSVLTDIAAGVGVSGRLVWNEFTGSEWQLKTVDNTDYVLCHVFATNSKVDPVVAFIGQGDYQTISQARAGAETEISTIITNYPSPELIPLGTIIFQTRNAYSNSVKARIRSTELGENYVDWRTSELQPGAAPSDHGNLAGLDWQSSGHSGTASTLAGFDSLGLATEYNESNYLLREGTRNLTGNWNYGSYYINGSGNINSTGLICDSNGCIGEGGGNPFNQSLNTSDNVTFQSLNLTLNEALNLKQNNVNITIGDSTTVTHLMFKNDYSGFGSTFYTFATTSNNTNDPFVELRITPVPEDATLTVTSGGNEEMELLAQSNPGGGTTRIKSVNHDLELQPGTGNEIQLQGNTQMLSDVNYFIQGDSNDFRMRFDGSNQVFNLTTVTTGASFHFVNITGWATLEAHDFITHTHNATSDNTLEGFTEDTILYDVYSKIRNESDCWDEGTGIYQWCYDVEWFNGTQTITENYCFYVKQNESTNKYFANFSNEQYIELTEVECSTYLVKGTSQGQLLTDIKATMVDINDNVDLLENYTQFNKGIISEEYITNTTKDPLTLIKVENFYNNLKYKSYQNMKDMILTEEGKLSDTILFDYEKSDYGSYDIAAIAHTSRALETLTLWKVAKLEERQNTLESELCSKDNSFSWCS